MTDCIGTFAADTSGRFSLGFRNVSALGLNVALLKRFLSIRKPAAAVAIGDGIHAQSPANTLQGRWDLTINASDRELPSWIEVSPERRRDKLVMVGDTDYATPVQKFEIKGTAIEFVSPQGEEGFPNDMASMGKLEGRKPEGTVTDAVGDSWHWTGVPAPSPDRGSAPQWKPAVKLFDEKDLGGPILESSRFVEVAIGLSEFAQEASSFLSFQIHDEAAVRVYELFG